MLGVAPKPKMDEELVPFFLSPEPDPKVNSTEFTVPPSFTVVCVAPKANGDFGIGSTLSAGALG